MIIVILNKTTAFVGLVIFCAVLTATPVLAAQDGPTVESATWRFEYDNDIFFGKDNKISSGWSLQRYTAVASKWEALQKVPDFVRRWGKAIPSLTGEGLVYRAGLAIGQVIQTPDNLSSSDLITDDVPYAGALTAQATWYAYNDNEFRGFEITAGIVGPLSFAEQTQKFVHELIGSTNPKGWDHQLSTEPVINLNYMRKKKFWRQGNPGGLSFDTALNGNFGLGNLFTQGSAGLEFRFGHNMPGGFVYVPDPIGLSMHYKASLAPAKPHEASLYATLVARGSVYAHNIFLDGNTFSNSHSVDKKPLVGLIVAGLHYEREHWGIHLNASISSHNLDTAKAPAAEGGEQIGTINIEWRF